MALVAIIDQADSEAIAYEELPGSPRETYSGSVGQKGESFSAVRELVCAWTDRHELAKRFKGDITASGTTTTVTPPQRYPDVQAARVVNVDIEPFDERPDAYNGDTARASYKKAKLSVQYATSPTNQDSGGNEDALVEESIEPWSEFITRSHEKLFWDSAQTESLEDTEAPQFVVRGFEWVYTRHRLASLPTEVLDLVGKVNADPIFTNKFDWSFDAETLLFQPPRLSWEVFPSGIKGVTARFAFTYRPGGWNNFYRKGFVDPQPLYDETGQQFKPYDTDDFTVIVG